MTTTPHTEPIVDLHLTKITIDRAVPYLQDLIDDRHRDPRRNAINRVGLHKELSAWFPFPGHNGQFRRHYQILWRVEATRKATGTILMTSRIPPDPWLAHHDFPSSNFATRFLAHPTQGQRVAFRIALAPIRRRKAPQEETDYYSTDTVHGKTIDEPIPENEREAWVTRILTSKAGLTLDAPITITRPEVSSRWPSGSKDFRHFSGTAVITDANQTEQALRNGLGRQRAYGGGLLSIKPIRS